MIQRRSPHRHEVGAGLSIKDDLVQFLGAVGAAVLGHLRIKKLAIEATELEPAG